MSKLECRCCYENDTREPGDAAHDINYLTAFAEGVHSGFRAEVIASLCEEHQEMLGEQLHSVQETERLAQDMALELKESKDADPRSQS